MRYKENKDVAINEFIAQVRAKVETRRTIRNDCSTQMMDLVAEVGRLAQALVDNKYDKGSLDHIYYQALSIAAMALLLAIDGDCSMGYIGV